MPTPTQALLLDLNVFTAENNIRRSALKLAVNIPSASTGGDITNMSFTLAPTTSRTIASITGNSGFVLRTKAPVRVTFTSTETTVQSKVMVTSLLIISDTLSSSVLIENLSSTASAKVLFLQI